MNRYYVYACIYIISIPIACILNKQFFIEKHMYFKLRNQSIVVSLTTTPYRINNMARTLQTILDQNAPINAIYLNVPYVYKRHNLRYKIPNWLKNQRKIKILRTEDYGPATKLLGLIEKETLDKDTIIITLDDDVYYPKNVVLQLAYNAMQNPEYAVGVSGADPNYDANGVIGTDIGLGLITRYQDEGDVTVLQGYGGVAYRAKFFDKDIFDIVNYPQDCILSDDMYFSFYLAKHNIPRKNVRNEFIVTHKIQWNHPFGTASDALHKQVVPMDKYRSCLLYMQQRDPGVTF